MPSAGGEQGSAAKWAHAAMALATRALELPASGAPFPAHGGRKRTGTVDPSAVLKIAQRCSARVLSARARSPPTSGPATLEPCSRPGCARSTSTCAVATCSPTCRPTTSLTPISTAAPAAPTSDAFAPRSPTVPPRLRGGDVGAAFGGLFDALVPVVPYAPATAFLGAEKAKLSPRPGERRRVALIADGIGATHGVTATIEKIRELGVPGFEIEVVGTDPGVDRRLPAAAELEVPFYAGMSLGVPGLPGLVETLAEGRYDAVHVTAPGPAGVAATLLSRIAGTPLIASYHTELAAYAGMRSGDDELESMAQVALGAFYRAPALVLSPSPAADRSLLALGIDSAAARALGARRRRLPLRSRQGRARGLPG